LNSLFKTADIDVSIIELVICKEEVVIGDPQVENYEHELKQIAGREDIEIGARYLAAATLSTEARKVQVYTRFYLTTTEEIRIEGCQDESISLVTTEEATNPERWRGAKENAQRWGPLIVQIIFSILQRVS